MKKTLLSFLLLFGMLTMIAQPAGEIFPDFTFSDINGEEHHLQSYLDEGKVVVIDVFATWCGVCQSSTGGMEELYTTYGQGGDESLVVLTFERDPNTSNEEQFISQYNIQSPVITEATDVIADEWNVTYQPRYFVICPDGTFNQDFIPPVYNDPVIIVENAESCASATSIDEIDLEDKFTLISSSVDQQLRYRSSVNLQYRIIDLTGSITETGSLQEGANFLDVSALPSGIYLINISDNQNVLTKRFVKKS